MVKPSCCYLCCRLSRSAPSALECVVVLGDKGAAVVVPLYRGKALNCREKQAFKFENVNKCYLLQRSISVTDIHYKVMRYYCF